MKNTSASVDDVQGTKSTQKRKSLILDKGFFVMADKEDSGATKQQIELFEKLCRKGAFILIGVDCDTTPDGVEARPTFLSNLRQSSEKLFFLTEALKFASEDQEKWEYLDGTFNLLGSILEDA